MKHLTQPLFFCLCLFFSFLQMESKAQNCIDLSKVNSHQVCPKLYSPVCGCDGRTYSNACEAQKAGVTSTQKGKCPDGTTTAPTPCIDRTKIKPNQNCPRIYSPVCGCNGKTYSNACEAQKAGVTSTKKGKCPDGTNPTPKPCIDRTKINPNQNCPRIYSPVCGCNGKTYSNACEAQKAGITSTKKGKCPDGTNPTPKPCIDRTKINYNQNCPRIYSPVCGCNGKTYSNACEAQKAGVTATKKGKCPIGSETTRTPCIDETKINSEQNCPKLYSPVCGCDGKTYNNYCEAQKAGISSTKKGRCQ